jgi:hypothetical protein
MVMAAALLLSTAGVSADNDNLTGVWHTTGGVTFYVRQVGNQVWWFGEQAAVNPRWTNVATGTLNGDTLTVQWVDVPMGGTRNQGSLGLRVVASNHMVVSQNPDNFWNADWYR